MHLFYTPDISSDTYTFHEEESKHAVQVLRLTIGDALDMTDGNGHFYKAEIIDNNRKRCAVKIIEKNKISSPNFYLHIAIAPTKNIERLEWFLEKATEIGINEITPIICEHSERKEVKTERLNKVIISAMKQSLKAYKPILNEAVSLKEFLKKGFQGEKYIAYCQTEKDVLLKDKYQAGKKGLILIGPEGDFSESEVERAMLVGFLPVSLGESRLRTETAGIVACHTINLINSH